MPDDFEEDYIKSLLKYFEEHLPIKEDSSPTFEELEEYLSLSPEELGLDDDTSSTGQVLSEKRYFEEEPIPSAEEIKHYLDEILYPGKIFYMEHHAYCEVDGLLSSKGSESDVYLIHNHTPFFNWRREEVVLPGTAFVLKVCWPKERDISTCVSRFKGSFSEFMEKYVGNLEDYCDPDEIRNDGEYYWPLEDINAYQLFKNSQFIEWLNRDYYDLFPLEMSKPLSFLEDESIWYRVIKRHKDIEKFLAEKRMESKFRDDPYLGEVIYPRFDSAIYEYVGPDLETVMKRRHFDEETKIKMVNRLFQAVYAIQSKGWIHKDINLSNILIGANDIPKINDFSMTQMIFFKDYRFGRDDIRSFIEADESYPFDPTELFIGSRLFMPPEVYKGYFSPRNDVWSIGLVAFSIFTGEHLVPIVDDNHRIMRAIEVSKEDKRLFVESMDKQIAENENYLKKVIHERVMEDPRIPEEYRKAIDYCTKVSPNTRRNMVKVLEYLGVPQPPRYIRKFHEHDKKIVYKDGKRYCSVCSLSRIDRWTIEDYEAFSEIPEELIWRGVSIEDALKDLKN